MQTEKTAWGNRAFMCHGIRADISLFFFLFFVPFFSSKHIKVYLFFSAVNFFPSFSLAHYTISPVGRWIVEGFSFSAIFSFFFLVEITDENAKALEGHGWVALGLFGPFEHVYTFFFSSFLVASIRAMTLW